MSGRLGFKAELRRGELVYKLCTVQSQFPSQHLDLATYEMRMLRRLADEVDGSWDGDT